MDLMKRREKIKMLKKLLGLGLIAMFVVTVAFSPVLAADEATCEAKCEEALVKCQNDCEEEANCKADCDHKNEECLKACKGS
jgi:hypothetical protein